MGKGLEQPTFQGRSQHVPEKINKESIRFGSISIRSISQTSTKRLTLDRDPIISLGSASTRMDWPFLINITTQRNRGLSRGLPRSTPYRRRTTSK